jgi:hypothetical protein
MSVYIVCAQCGASFPRSRATQRFCSSACKDKFHNAHFVQKAQLGQALYEISAETILWELEHPQEEESQLSWTRRELIFKAFSNAREAAFRHLERTLGVDRRLLKRLEQAYFTDLRDRGEFKLG